MHSTSVASHDFRLIDNGNVAYLKLLVRTCDMCLYSCFCDTVYTTKIEFLQPVK